jgi:predicted thioredoxin/glutaredoxin
MPSIQIYSRPGCHLCEQLIEEITPLLRGRAVLEILNIDSRPDWREEYDSRVPVVELDGRLVCEYRLDRAALHRALSGTDSGP